MVADDDELGAVPLRAMSIDERLTADFRGTGLAMGPHPMAYHREPLNRSRANAVTAYLSP
jgi:error-prone DNA polymerase